MWVYKKQWHDKQRSYKVKSCRVRATNFFFWSWKSNEHYVFWVRICSLSYPGRNAHAPYYIATCGLSTCANILPHYLTNDAIFGKTLLNINCVFISSTNFVWNISHSKNNSVRYYHKRTYIFMWSTGYSYVYRTVHHLDGWIKRDQLDVTCFFISLFDGQHVSDVNTVKPRFTNALGWTIRFTSKFSEHKASRMTYCVSSYEQASRQKKRKRIPFQTITFHFLTTFHLHRQLSSIQVR